jgi:hypothetical protein
VSWDGIIAISEVIGVIAIFASIIYVAVQIRQNNSIARATMIHQTNTIGARTAELVASDAELADIYRRGLSGESLSGVELVRFLALVEIYLAWLEDIDSQFEAGLYFQEEEVDDMVDHMSSEVVSYFSTPEVREWWHDAKHVYAPSFARKLDKHISKA